MKLLRIITLIARVAFITTMLLGLFSWIAQLFFLNMLLNVLAQIRFTSIHEGVGLIGVLALLFLAGMAVFKREIRLLGVGTIIYALLVPAFGLTQQLFLMGHQHWLIQVAHLLVGIGAMVLLRRIEKRNLQLKLKEHRESSERPLGRPYPPIVTRLARLGTSAHVALYRLTGGAIGGRAQHMSVLLLTSTGRKSGKQYTTPLVYFADGDDVVVVASNGGQGKLPNWWLNIRQSKQASMEIGRKRFQASVQEAKAEERQRLWAQVVAYGAGHETYQERTPYPIPLIIFHPVAGSSISHHIREKEANINA